MDDRLDLCMALALAAHRGDVKARWMLRLLLSAL